MHIRSLPLRISSAVGSTLLLGAGWLWARLVVSGFQRTEGVTLLSGSPRAAQYEFWGTTLPGTVTANAIVVVAVLSLFTLCRRRDAFSLLALSTYFLFLAFTGARLFAGFEMEAFD
jgi:hypothetical protein